MCDLCARDRNQYDPACLGCGGRYLRDIQRLRLDPSTKRERLRKALADWKAHGHAEDELRELAKPAAGKR